MIAPVELHRDESGAVVLTAEQARLLARWWRDGIDSDEWNELVKPLDLAIEEAGGTSLGALWAWVARWAPVVAAAEAAVDARAAATFAGNWVPGAPMRRLQDAEDVLGARVRVARSAGAS